MERGRGMGLMPGSGYGIELRRLKLRHSQLEKDVAAAKIAIREEESARRPMVRGSVGGPAPDQQADTSVGR